MDEVRRRGSAARLGYIKRFGCVLLACAICFSLMAPPRAEAVFVVDDVVIAMAAMVVASCGVSFIFNGIVESGFVEWFASSLNTFLTETGRSITDFLSDAVYDHFTRTGEVKLTAAQTAVFKEFIQSLVEKANTQVFDGYFTLDGSYIFFDGIYSSLVESLPVLHTGKNISFPDYPGFWLELFGSRVDIYDNSVSIDHFSLNSGAIPYYCFVYKDSKLSINVWNGSYMTGLGGLTAAKYPIVMYIDAVYQQLAFTMKLLVRCAAG